VKLIGEDRRDVLGLSVDSEGVLYVKKRTTDKAKDSAVKR